MEMTKTKGVLVKCEQGEALLCAALVGLKWEVSSVYQAGGIWKVYFASGDEKIRFEQAKFPLEYNNYGERVMIKLVQSTFRYRLRIPLVTGLRDVKKMFEKYGLESALVSIEPEVRTGI